MPARHVSLIRLQRRMGNALGHEGSLCHVVLAIWGSRPLSVSSLTRLGYETRRRSRPRPFLPSLSGTRSGGACPDGHRQDRRVRSADDRASRCVGPWRASARSPRGLVLVPTRELALQVHRGAVDLRRAGAAPRHRHFRRRRHGRRRSSPWARHRHRRRHAGPADRSHAAAHDRSVCDRSAHARRGRPDARHGLSAGASPGARRRCRARVRRCCSRRRCRTTWSSCSTEFTREPVRVDVSEGRPSSPDGARIACIRSPSIESASC